jgi:hypothetical protein
MSVLGSLTSALKGAGLTGSDLASAVSSVFSAATSSSPNAAVKKCLTAILANSASPAIVADEAKQLAEIPNLPGAIQNLLPGLNAATTPIAVVEAVQAMEEALGTTGFSLFG